MLWTLYLLTNPLSHSTGFSTTWRRVTYRVQRALTARGGRVPRRGAGARRNERRGAGGEDGG